MGASICRQTAFNISPLQSSTLTLVCWCGCHHADLRLICPSAQVINTHDKAQQAACAEIVAGLLSSGAAFVEPTDGTSSGSSWLLPLLEGALRTSTLEMADCWAVAVR